MALKTSKNVQIRLLAFLMRDKQYKAIKEIITPDIFEDKRYAKFCTYLRKYRDLFPEDRIKKSGFKQFLKDILERRSKIDDLIIYVKVLNKIANIEITDKAYLRRLAIEYAKKRRFEECLDEGISEDGSWNYELVYEKFKKIMNLGLDDVARGHLYFKDRKERIAWYEDTIIAPFSTGFRWLDERLDLGGLFGGELVIFLAAPGIGKSWILLMLGNNQIIQNQKNFSLFSLEMSALKIARRLDSITSKLTKGEFFSMMPELKGALRRAKKIAVDADLDIKAFSTKTCTVEMIDEYLEWAYTETGFLPTGGIAVDYLNILKLSEVNKNISKYDKLESAAEGLRQLAQKWKCPVYTAMQGNRASLQKRNLDLDDLAESFAPAFVADHIIAISQTRKETKTLDKNGFQKVRIIQIKNREEASTMPIHLLWNKSFGLLKLDPEKKKENTYQKFVMTSDKKKIKKLKLMRKILGVKRVIK